MQSHLTLVEILLGRDHYLIDGDIIDKFVRPLKTISVYDSPDYIEGMAKWGEEMIPVINIAPLLGMEKTVANKQRTLIVHRGTVSEYEMAVSVDDVYNIRAVLPADIMPAEISACKGMEEYVKGLIRLKTYTEDIEEDLLLLYLNLQKMLTNLLRGRIARPSPDFYVWRWENSGTTNKT
ncbi:MAG: chemotaxis protein CheW [Methanomicrobiales archaeon]|nr:chemotaxis protein CheW [Methanomicrobiales archaeon]